MFHTSRGFNESPKKQDYNGQPATSLIWAARTESKSGVSMTQAPYPRWPFPRVLGHRGGGTLAPENTLAGLHTAYSYGFGGAEFDAKLTRDGVAILMHDDTLDRTTNGYGPV